MTAITDTAFARLDAEGRLLAEIAAEWGVTQQQACRRLQPGGACYFQMHEDDVEKIIAHPLAMIGSDGLPHDRHPHPRLWGTFPRVLARYCRERKLFRLAGIRGAHGGGLVGQRRNQIQIGHGQ